MGKNKNDHHNVISCSFCDRKQHEVEKLIAGVAAHICSECIRACARMLNAHTHHDAKRDDAAVVNSVTELPKPREIHAYLDEYIIGQDYAKKILSVAVYNHYKRVFLAGQGNGEADELESVELAKSNVLLIGPTGCGKTLLARKLASFLHVPFLLVDATTLTETGYVGDDVEGIVERLLQRCDYDVARAEKAIVYIDEIDKIARRRADSFSATRDPSGEGVQQALLKLIEGTTASVVRQGQRRYPKTSDCIEVNTDDMLFICGGAFADLDRIILERTSHASIGFGAMVLGRDSLQGVDAILSQVRPEDLIRYGLIPEFVGRLPIVATLNELDEDKLVAILTQPKDAIVKQYKKLFSMEGVDVVFEKEALQAVAKLAMERKTGARGLRSILESILLDTMYDLPSLQSLKSVLINTSVVEQKTKPLLTYQNEQGQADA